MSCKSKPCAESNCYYMNAVYVVTNFKNRICCYLLTIRLASMRCPLPASLVQVGISLTYSYDSMNYQGKVHTSSPSLYFWELSEALT